MFGDRVYAVLDSAGPRDFPYFTGRDRREMLLYRPRFRIPQAGSQPPHQQEALQLAALSPVHPNLAELEVNVDTPSGTTLAVDDPALLAMLAGERPASMLSLLRSHRPMTDCRPVSLISLETIEQLGDEIDANLDKRRFRANICAQLGTAHAGNAGVYCAVLAEASCGRATRSPGWTDTASQNAYAVAKELLRLDPRLCLLSTFLHLMTRK